MQFLYIMLYYNIALVPCLKTTPNLLFFVAPLNGVLNPAEYTALKRALSNFA